MAKLPSSPVCKHCSTSAHHFSIKYASGLINGSSALITASLLNKALWAWIPPSGRAMLG